MWASAVAATVDPGTNRVFAIARDKIVVIDGRTNRVLTTHVFNRIPVASGIADDPSTGLLYMSASVGPNAEGFNSDFGAFRCAAHFARGDRAASAL